MDNDLTILLVATVTFFIGGLAKGAMGFGLPMIAIPMLTAFGSLPLALSIAVPPVVATNLWQLWKFREHRNQPFLRGFMIAGVFGLAAGIFLLKNIKNTYLEILLGCLVLSYLLIRRQTGGGGLPPQRVEKIAPVIGVFAGTVHGMMGLSGLVGTPFFHAANLQRPAFIFSNCLMFTVFSSLHLPSLAFVGLYQSQALLIGLLVMVPAFAGVWAGGMLGERLKASTFPILVQSMLIIAAILPIWNGLSHLFSST